MPTPPRAPRKLHLHTLHGHERPDSYHWLRSQGKADPEVLAYLQAENDHLAGVMAPLRAEQQAIYQELLSHVQERDEQPEVVRGAHAYFTRTETGQAHPLYLRRPLAGGEPQLLLDLNVLKAEEGLDNVWVYATAPSPDGRFWAYLLDTTGQEVFELRVLDTETGGLAQPPLRGLNGWVPAWSADGRALHYATDDATQRSYRLWRHQLGQPQTSDTLLFQEDDPTFRVGAWVSENGQTLLICSASTRAQEWWALSAHDTQGQPTRLLARERGTEVPVLTDGGDHWLALTNHGGAEEFKLVRWSRRADGAPLAWADAADVLPYDEGRHLQSGCLFQGHLLLAGREDGFTALWVLPRQGGGYGPAQRVPFPEASVTVGIGPNYVYDSAVARITYTSLTRPLEHLNLNLKTLETTLVKAAPVPNYDPALYVSEQVWATAPGGERIPVSLLRRRDTPLPAPTLLYGYGSYGLSVNPTFVAGRLPLVDRGWVWAIAHIRGGSERGRRWYDGGRLGQKMNTFTDFIAAGEALRAQGVSRELVAMGRSAGGLLMGSVVNLRPDLWTAALVGVPFVDVLSTMLDDTIPLTTAEYDEWGNPNRPEDYAVMAAYSPYDNLKAARYPHLFVSTGLNDPRVAYWEPAKYAARVRDLAAPDSGTVVLKTIMGAGHGGSSSRYEALNELAEEYAFVLAAVAGQLPATAASVHPGEGLQGGEARAHPSRA
ncbi:S9 family peptidase [Deinococcus arcticus]|uniref:S9 family peptidase n=1 Tax=Deinococcus arcticus TaxID=2136176 RepID=A0A2T3WBF8_9DEIO|nr:S9 family peptidase [Deinococcus arcticus]PTA69172.1 S9 family peptidase [Deinococcus arcticus]